LLTVLLQLSAIDSAKRLSLLQNDIIDDDVFDDPERQLRV